MKKFISAIIGITTFTSMSICSAFTGTYHFINDTDQPVCFGKYESVNSTLTPRPERIERHQVGTVTLTTHRCSNGGGPELTVATNKLDKECAYGSFKYGTNCPRHSNQTDACFVFYQKNDNYKFHWGTDGSVLNCNPVDNGNGTYTITITKK